MAAYVPLISVPKNLYKHFAVLTVVITACVAIFAEGESKQAIAERSEQRQAAKEQRAERARPASQRSVAGLRDNRGVVHGNDDVGAPAAVGPQLAVVTESDYELGEPTLATAVRRLRPVKRTRKLPAVLPPGMPPVPGVEGSADEPAAPAQPPV